MLKTYPSEDKFTKAGLEEIIKTNIGANLSNEALLINVRNFQLLRAWANKQGIRDSQIFADVEPDVVEKCLSKKKDEFTTNIISQKIFENIGIHFPTDPQIFRTAGEEALKINKVKFRLMPYITGRKITDIATILGGINAEFNRTKKFIIDTHPYPENPSFKRTVVTVEQLPGLFFSDRVYNWNIGIYNAMVQLSTDKIHEIKPSFDKNLGTFKYEVIYESRPLKLIDKLFFNVASKFEEEQRRKLENSRRFMDNEMNLIHGGINSELKNAMSRVSALETKHPASAFHSYRVATYALLLGKQLGLDTHKLANLSVGAPMHDDGKIAIPESILHKEGKFTSDEQLIMRTHSVLGKYYLLELGYPAEVARLTTEHQERADGSGYPFEVDYTRTSQLGLIMQICDIYDALQDKRSYKESWSMIQIINEFEKLISDGKLYEPFGNFFLKYTLPIITELDLKYDKFDFSQSLFEKKEHNTLVKDLVGYFKGQNTLFDVRSSNAGKLERFISNHYIEPKSLTEQLDLIGDYLLKTYLKLESFDSRKSLMRVIPLRYKNTKFKDLIGGDLEILRKIR